VTARAVRLYESKGLLPSADRSQSGYRVFGDTHVETLTFIRQARSLGLSLEAIAEIVNLDEDEGEGEDYDTGILCPAGAPDRRSFAVRHGRKS
jgi:DNA-binding transcriptional MerR regulator